MRNHTTTGKSQIIFWCSWFLLNSLLFVTRYATDMERSPFFPISFLFEGDWYTRLKVIFIRPGFDIFRLNVELVLLFMVTRIFKHRFASSSYWFWFAWILYFILLLYAIYHGAMEGIYQSQPLFFNDLSLLKTGFTIISNEHWTTLLAIISALLGLTIISWVLMRIWITGARVIVFGRGSKIVFFIFALLILLNLKYGTSITTRNAIQPTSVLVLNNLKNSKQAARMLSTLDFDRMKERISYANYTLTLKPNIYVLVLESYGEIVFKSDSIRSYVIPTMKTFEKILQEQGWYCASGLAESPVFGGKSWIAYSSLLYGFDFRNQGTYDALFYRNDIPEFPSWPAVLQKFGYSSYRLNTLPPADLIDVQWERMNRFYHIDEWIRFEDLGYYGKSYGFGPAPPDQFGLNKAYSIIQEKKESNPTFFFFLNQNTHHPYESPGKAVENWEALNDSSQKTTQDGIGFLGSPSLLKYRQALNYEWDYLQRFICERLDTNSVVLIIGDHPPPFISDPSEPRNVPFHFVTKNPDWIPFLIQNGCSQGMIPNSQSIYHQAGIYSLFMHTLLSLNNINNPPPIYPNGFNHDQKAQ
jgi:hypothetical protein